MRRFTTFSMRASASGSHHVYRTPSPRSLLSTSLLATSLLATSSNPDRWNWTTVNGNALTMSGEASAPDILGAHDAGRYAEFAKSAFASGNVSVDSWQASADGFFSGSNTHIDYGAQR